jgi:hypothetical protein
MQNLLFLDTPWTGLGFPTGTLGSGFGVENSEILC